MSRRARKYAPAAAAKRVAMVPVEPRAKCCEHCNDGDGFSVFPYYGVAPHVHVGDSMIGSTRVLPRDEWPENFEEDPECPGLGGYTHCPYCGAGR